MGELAPQGPWTAFFFLFFAVASLVLSLLGLSRRDPLIGVALFTGAFVAVAGGLALISAHVVAVLVLLLYGVGAALVFLCLMMTLNRYEISPVAWSGLLARLSAGVALLWLAIFVVSHLARLSRVTPILQAPLGTSPANPNLATLGRYLFSSDLPLVEGLGCILALSVVAIAMFNGKASSVARHHGGT